MKEKVTLQRIRAHVAAAVYGVWYSPFGLFGQLFGDVPADEHRFQVDPEVLHEQPPLQHLVRVRQVRQPVLDLLPERRVVPTQR